MNENNPLPQPAVLSSQPGGAPLTSEPGGAQVTGDPRATTAGPGQSQPGQSQISADNITPLQDSLLQAALQVQQQIQQQPQRQPWDPSFAAEFAGQCPPEKLSQALAFARALVYQIEDRIQAINSGRVQ